MATFIYSYVPSMNTNYIDPFIASGTIYTKVAIKQYPKEKDKKVFLILNSKEKSYKVAPDDYHF